MHRRRWRARNQVKILFVTSTPRLCVSMHTVQCMSALKHGNATSMRVQCWFALASIITGPNRTSAAATLALPCTDSLFGIRGLRLAFGDRALQHRALAGKNAGILNERGRRCFSGAMLTTSVLRVAAFAGTTSVHASCLLMAHTISFQAEQKAAPGSSTDEAQPRVVVKKWEAVVFWSFGEASSQR